MDVVRIGFYWQSCTEFHVVHVILQMDFYGIIKEKGYISVMPEFSPYLGGKYLINDKLLCVLKNSATSFYEYLVKFRVAIRFEES
jgi:hypothetical protein